MAEKETAAAEGAAETLEAGDFSSLLEKEFKPKSERAREAVEGAVATLAEQALAVMHARQEGKEARFITFAFFPLRVFIHVTP